MPAYRLSTAAQLAEIRAGLLGPRELFARVQGLFAAEARSTVERRKAHRLKSAGRAEGLQKWEVDGSGCIVKARTKSEARAVLKSLLGKLTPGVEFERVA